MIDILLLMIEIDWLFLFFLNNLLVLSLLLLLRLSLCLSLCFLLSCLDSCCSL